MAEATAFLRFLAVSVQKLVGGVDLVGFGWTGADSGCWTGKGGMTIWSVYLLPSYRVPPRKLSGLHRLARLHKVAVQGATKGATERYIPRSPNPIPNSKAQNGFRYSTENSEEPFLIT